MKKIGLIFIFISLSQIAFTQDFSLAFNAGVGKSHYSFNEIKYLNYDASTFVKIVPYKTQSTGLLGAHVNYKFNKKPWCVQLGLDYSTYGAEINIQDGANNTSRLIDERGSRVEMPLNLIFQRKVLRIIGGFSYAFDLNRSQTLVNYLNSNYVSTSQFQEGFTSAKANYFTFNMGVGFSLKNMAFDFMLSNPFNQVIEKKGGTYNFGPNPSLVLVKWTYYLQLKNKNEPTK